MELSEFCRALKKLIQIHSLLNQQPIQSKVTQCFLAELANLRSGYNDAVNMTKATVLFEGFYHYQNLSSLKEAFGGIRAKRWKHHYGTPTITFLLTYNAHIDNTTCFFHELASGAVSSFSDLPWNFSNALEFVVDNENNIMVDPTSISRVESPKSREVTGIFTKTHNPCGGYTTTPCDPVSQQFIRHAALSAQNGGKVLEIGAGFGAATLEAIAVGASVFCNDNNPKNLAVVRSRFLESIDEPYKSTTGDSDKLVLIPGELPHELIGLPENYFDAILICRVLHFFSGTQIEKSLTLLSNLLTTDGKIYIVCETPFLKNWQPFIPEFTRRVEIGIEWPGEITEPSEYEISGRAASLPKFVHWISKEILERSLERTGFAIESVEYINRCGQFPEDLLLPEYGKESVGAIGRIVNKRCEVKDYATKN